MTTYPKRLIEVDLPIKRISAHARREKSIRHGHISTLHIWWARRPLAACRAVICASLWPDPADPLCPEPFCATARTLMTTWARQHWGLASAESYQRLSAIQNSPDKLDDNVELRATLLDFIADFANWDNSTKRPYLDTSRALTQAAHEALGGEPDTKPLVVDPFAGGGSIPLEALRVGADAFASDLNPIAVLLNKVVLEYIPHYGQRLADEVRKWGAWVKEQAEQELAEFYPKDADGATPIAYLWARTIKCEGPECGTTVPLLRSLWLSKRPSNSVALRLVPDPGAKRVCPEIVAHPRSSDVAPGTVRKGAASCPICGYTTPVTSVRRQLKSRRGGAADAQLLAVVTGFPGQQGRHYRSPRDQDLRSTSGAASELAQRSAKQPSHANLVPEENFTGLEPRRIPIPQYGMEGFRDLFTPRQTLALTTLVRLVKEVRNSMPFGQEELSSAVRTCLALVIGRQADKLSSLARWDSSRENPQGTFARQALPIVWDFNEVNPFSGAGGDWNTAVDWVARVIEHELLANSAIGQVSCFSATSHPLPDDVVDAFITDPPYYYSVPYADLSDFFYVWLRQCIVDIHPDLLKGKLTPKAEECVQNLPHSAVAHVQKDRRFYEGKMQKALSEGVRIAKRSAVGTVVFAHSDTEAWESLLAALIGAGWLVTASWPIDTEMATRTIALRQSTLASSVHLVCRPRFHAVGVHVVVGDWRDVLQELPRRIHDWMPRLAADGVVGADAIFACLGPALEIFSRYDRVEKASGEEVKLKDYLEHVWAAVAREALGVIFSGADVTGFEPDARLTAMWLWTLFAGATPATGGESDDAEADEGEAAPAKTSGYVGPVLRKLPRSAK